LRLTLQVTDVLRLRRRALRSKDQQPQNVVEENCTKGVSPTAILWSPNRRIGGEQLPFVRRSTIVLHIKSRNLMNLRGQALRYRRFIFEIFAYTGEQIPRTPSTNRPKGCGIKPQKDYVFNNLILDMHKLLPYYCIHFLQYKFYFLLSIPKIIP